jgi:phage-related protein
VELKNSGIHPKENISGHLEYGIFGLRASIGNRILRSFYFYKSEEKVIFTHGFVKKEQKTPKIEIAKAKFISEL